MIALGKTYSYGAGGGLPIVQQGDRSDLLITIHSIQLFL